MEADDPEWARKLSAFDGKPWPDLDFGDVVVIGENGPAEIRGDVAVLVGVAEDVQVALSDGDKASMEAAKQRVATSHEAWKAASDNVVSYASTVCDVELGRDE